MNCSEYIIFHWIFTFSEKEDFSNVHTKVFYKAGFLLRVYVPILFTIMLLLYHWLHNFSVQTEIICIYVQIILALCCSR